MEKLVGLDTFALAQLDTIRQKDTLRLSLDLAERLAEAGDLGLFADRYRLYAAEADTIGAALYPNPQFSFNTTNINGGNLRDALNGIGTSYRIDQTILLGGKLSNKIAVVDETTAAKRAEFVREVFTVRADTRDAVTDASYQLQQIEVAQEQYAEFAKLIEASKVQLKAGEIAEEELLKLELQELTYRQALSQSQQVLTEAMSKLREHLHVDTTIPISIEYTLRMTGKQFNRDSLLALAYNCRADYWAQEHALRATEYQMRLAQANVWPDLNIGIELDHISAVNTLNPNTLGGGVGIAIPIFSRNQDDVVRSDANHRAAQYDLESIRANISLEVLSSLDKYENSLSMLQSLNVDALHLALEVRHTAEYNYEARRISLLDLLATENVTTAAIAGYYAALYQLAKNQVTLERAVGVELF